MDDVIAKDKVKLKWVGTSPIRPDAQIVISTSSQA